MKHANRLSHSLTTLGLLVATLAMAGCAASSMVGSAANMIPLFSVEVQVVDENDQPVSGAIVESSGNQQIATGPDGMATLRFGAVGLHVVTVVANDRVPSAVRVTMPSDNRKTVTARLGQPVDMSGITSALAGSMNLLSLSAAQLYPMMFQYMFSAYGYNIDLAEYAPGQWTHWVLRADDEEEMFQTRKAFLNRMNDGNQWWQIRLLGEQEAADESATFEVLFSAERSSIRRMRQQIGTEEVREVPVTEGWYASPMQLTPESIDGAVTQRNVSVRVPAGSFQADLIEFSAVPGMTLRMWRVPSVPGGVVRYEMRTSDGDAIYVGELKEHGSGARTDLGSY